MFKIKFKTLAYNFRNAETLSRSNVNSVKYGTGIINSLRVKICKSFPNAYKDLRPLSTFISNFKNWEKDECPCRLSKTYIKPAVFFVVVAIVFCFVAVLNWYHLGSKSFAELCKFSNFEIKESFLCQTSYI